MCENCNEKAKKQIERWTAKRVSGIIKAGTLKKLLKDGFSLDEAMIMSQELGKAKEEMEVKNEQNTTNRN